MNSTAKTFQLKKCDNLIIDLMELLFIHDNKEGR